MPKTAKLNPVMIAPSLEQALQEDMGRGGDITSQAVIPEGAIDEVVMNSREDGIAAGLDIAKQVFEMVNPEIIVTLAKSDGDRIQAGDVLLTAKGPARDLLLAERVALNFAGHLSGIATKTNHMVQAVGNYRANIASTRKTLPNLRIFQKYAVRVGGGVNHRLGLDDAILIKDNHIAMAGGITAALERAHQYAGHMVKIEIEVDTLEQLDEVLETGADVIMLDNFSLDDLKIAVERAKGKAILEASGGVTLDTVSEIASTGVDVISVGGLTHSAMNLDIGLDYKVAA